MAKNRIKLNEEKDGTRQQMDKITMRSLTLPNAVVPFSTVVNDFGVKLESQLRKCGRSCFCAQVDKSSTNAWRYRYTDTRFY